MIETRVDGEPRALRAAATFLLLDLGRGLDDLADRVADERATALGTWQGEAGRAFADQAVVLARAGDEAADGVRALGWRLEELAGVLEAVQEGMAQLRDMARGAGLRVVGTAIAPPAVALPVGAPASETEQALHTAYAAAGRRADELLLQWTGALAAAADAVGSRHVVLAQLSAGMLSDGYSTFLRTTLSPVLRGQSDFLMEQSAEAVADLARVRSDLFLGRTTPSAAVEEQLAALERRAAEAAEESQRYATSAQRHEVATKAVRGLGGALVLYGVYDDIRRGESVGQAAVSQGAGFGAGAAAAAWCGTVATPVAPGVGSVAGAVVCGAVASIGVGLLADKAYVAVADALTDPPEQEAPAEEQQRLHDERRVRALLAGGRRG